MNNTSQTSVNCMNCGQPLNIPVRSIIDAQADPQGKMLLLNGQLNAGTCPNCGTPNTVLTPLLYHDASKELLIAHIPAEVALQTGRSEEKILGEMMNALSSALPQDQFKAYMFNPRRTLSMQGLMNQVLEADGITPEMIEEQQKRITLVQSMIEADSELLDALITERDAEIDATFFQAFSLVAQRLLQAGDAELADRLVAVQEKLVEHSSYGKQLIAQQEAQNQILEEVAQELQQLGEGVQRSDMIELVLRYRDKEDHLQALVGLVRQAFDYQFFQEFTDYIAKAPADQREVLQSVRQFLTDLTQKMDEQMRSVAQEASGLLQEMVNSPNLEQLIAANLPRIDDTFMQVLSLNLQEAQRRQDQNALARLQEIYEKVMTVLQAQMQPELRFINDLLSTNTEQEAKDLISEKIADFDEELLEVFDAVQRVFQSQGNQGALQKLTVLRQHIQQALQ